MAVPGSNFITKSGKIKAFTSGPTTERLLIIGTAQDGPLNTPVPVTNTSVAERTFGPVTYSGGYKNPVTSSSDDRDAGASIPRAVQQAIAAGCTDIWVVRATGTIASVASALSGKLNIQALNPGRIYNESSLGILSSGGILYATVTQPSVKGETYTTQYASTLTVGEFIDRINSDPKNKCFAIVKDTFASILASSCYTLGSTALVTSTLTGGTNGCQAPSEDYGLALDGYATALTTEDTGTFATLLGDRFGFDVVVLTGIHLDDQVVTSGGSKPGGGTWSSSEEYTVSIVTDYVVWLDAISTNVRPCFGVIACRPNNVRDVTSIVSYVNNNLLETTAAKYNASLRWNKAGYFLYTGFNVNYGPDSNVDLGARLGVVAGPAAVYTHPALGNYTDNFHVSYAAMLTTMPPERAPIFKQIPGIVGYATPFPGKYCDLLVEGVGRDQDNDLSGRGAYVVLTKNPRNSQGPLVVYNDVTAAFRDDYLRTFQLVHLVNSIESHLDQQLFDFLGGPTDHGTLAAMETVVQNVLDGFVQSRGLKGGRGMGYDFEITMDGIDQYLGIIRVNLEIAPATALTKIYFTVSVRQNA